MQVRCQSVRDRGRRACSSPARVRGNIDKCPTQLCPFRDHTSKVGAVIVPFVNSIENVAEHRLVSVEVLS